MGLNCIILVLAMASIALGQQRKCDLTPPNAKDPVPREGRHPFSLEIESGDKKGDETFYTESQTYVLALKSSIPRNRTFRWFMITAEDPNVDETVNNRLKAVGNLKTLDITQSRHSERCSNSVENFDNSDKNRVEVHWVSPIETDRVRIRAMVAENEEMWYEGENLTLILVKTNREDKDSSPYTPVRQCDLCSEARYEVIFNGKWSRVAHPRYYPTKPDQNGYSHMIGASHDYDFLLWHASSKARNGLRQLLEDANSTELEREIIDAMFVENGTRTLIRGKRRHHPHMFEPSHSLFRVDRIHHLFSIVVGMRPSPDWFLGMTQFELCVGGDWLKYYKVDLYPWDAGTRSGVSYESETAPTNDHIHRVEVGSFNKLSPFYQLNLNDLKPYASLEVRRLDVYPLDESECNTGEAEAASADASDEPQADPILGESRQKLESTSRCYLGEWGEWTPCVADVGGCGIGAQTRTRQPVFYNYDVNAAWPVSGGDSCNGDEDADADIQHCYVAC